MQVCPRCGAHAADTLRFCTACGTSLQVEAPTQLVAGPACTRCGAALVPGLRFCTSCGTQVVAAAPTPPPPPPPPLDRGPRRSRGPIVLAVVLVLVLVAGGGVAAWWLSRDDESTTATDRHQEEREDASDEATDEATDETDADPSLSESSDPVTTSEAPSTVSTPSPPDGARCWDGSGAPAVDDCPYPSGQAGLEWVFPSMAEQVCTDVKALTGSPRVEFWECYDYLEDGTEVRLNYSQWSAISQGRSHFENFLGEAEEVTNKDDEPALYRWNGIVEGEYERAVLDAREPFSVAVFVPYPEQRSEAFEQLVRLRPGTQFLGVPTR